MRLPEPIHPSLGGRLDWTMFASYFKGKHSSRYFVVVMQDGHGAMHLAAANGHCETLQVLMELGADVHAQSYDGLSVMQVILSILHFATTPQLVIDKRVYSTKSKLRGVDGQYKRLILNNVQSFYRLTKHHARATILRPAAYRGVKETCARQETRRGGNLALVGNTCESGCGVRAHLMCGGTRAQVAAGFGQTEAVKVLAELGASPSACIQGVGTALHTAAAAGHLEAVAALLELGADPSSRDADGCTALHVAAAGGHSEVLRCLVEAADVDVHAPAQVRPH